MGGDTAAAVLAARVEQENNYAALLTLWPEIGAKLPAIAQRLQQIAPGLAQLIFSVNANDGSGSARDAKPGESLFETNGQGSGSSSDPGKEPDEERSWNYGDHKNAAKWESQMARRGWTEQQIDQAIKTGQRFDAPNNINPANGATRYVNPETGRSVVIDNITKQILHVGGDGFAY